MEIKEYRKYCEDEILRLYASVGWTAYTDDPAALERGFRHSLLVLAAWEDGELAGLIRAVGDGATIVFIQDILGFKVFDLRVDRVIGHIRDVLTSNPAHDMYEIAGEDGRLIYIPAIKPFLKEIDMDAGIVYVESIEGLIE